MSRLGVCSRPLARVQSWKRFLCLTELGHEADARDAASRLRLYGGWPVGISLGWLAGGSGSVRDVGHVEWKLGHGTADA